MKVLLGVLASALISVGAVAGEKVNSKESLRLCKSAMESDVPSGTTYKFKRNTATSVETDRYKHWINFLEITDSDKSAKKLLCETTRSGEILVLQIKPGKWKI